jgi:hypothetical protein
MVINYFDDPNRIDLGLIEATSRLFGEQLMVGFEDQARGTSQVEGVLTGAVRSKGVQASCSAADVGERRGGTEHCEATPQDLPLLQAEVSDARTICRTILGELPVGPENVNR